MMKNIWRLVKKREIKTKLRLVVILMCFVGYFLYRQLPTREYIIKFPEQCTAYPNKAIKLISERNYSFNQIDVYLKKFGIMDGGLYVPKNKSIIFNYININN